MCSVPLDLFTMLERQGSDFSDAMRKMNPPTHVATMKRGQSATGRRGGGRDHHNAKKMYEEAQVWPLQFKFNSSSQHLKIILILKVKCV